MLILAKTALAIMLGYIFAAISGFVFIPMLKKINARQKINVLINKRHLKKEGTPTMGGIIFIVPTLIVLLLLYLKGSIKITHNLVILVVVFLSYGFIGFLDDYLKIKRKSKSGNEGLKSWQKLLLQVIVATVFFFIYRSYGGSGDLTLSLFGLNFKLGWGY